MKPPVTRLLPCVLLLPVLFRVLGDGPADNRPEKVRPVPPLGITVPEETRRELAEGVARLGKALDDLSRDASQDGSRKSRLADVAIFHKAVDWALRHDEFFRTNEFRAANALLEEGTRRLEALRAGRAPWTATNGPVVAGYVSRIDGSVQPYGLVIPRSWTPDSGRRWRLDTWFHGRGEQLGELAFLTDRMRNPGEFTPPDTFVLHLYGRYCNGSRFAGETDFWEALADVRSRYPIDEDRLVVRGFSLGGASAWHFGVHHAARWAAVAPGAGFSETAEFLKVFQKEKLAPAWWEQKLWRLHDATANALNLAMVPTVAYSGHDDSQIQAADAMHEAMAREGMELAHIVGPKTGHKYEPAAKAELNRRIDAIAAIGRKRVPQQVRFVTHSLRYNEMAWITVDSMLEHWEPARVVASLQGAPGSADISATTTNVAGLSFVFEAGDAPMDVTRPVTVVIDGQAITTDPPKTDRSWRMAFHRDGGEWIAGPASVAGLRKRHGLQGPIDDAFMDSFLMVLPGGTPMNPEVGRWVASESDRAIREWRRHYRGDARQRLDKEVTEDDIRDHNLVLWGDPTSNALLARIADRLPIRWDGEKVSVGARTYSASGHVPVMVFPNPLNPTRYVVINSGFTFREYDYLNNARQTPKLPDWAIIGISTPPGSRAPGAIEDAGFFDERWRLK
jgi:pimeloyl-ACP methyl ester carboxylesterase